MAGFLAKNGISLCGRDCDRMGRERDPKEEAMPVVCGNKNIIIGHAAGFFQRGRDRTPPIVDATAQTKGLRHRFF